MNKGNPKVTVLMPAYNAAKYISEAIYSVLNQSFTNFELLIINDGSTDNTSNIINGFADSRIVVINLNVNKGVACALNKGLEKAKGIYIARFDADDICFKERLLKQVTFLDANPDYILVGSDAEYILENGDFMCNYRCKNHTYDSVLVAEFKNCPFIHSAVLYKKDDVIQAGGYSPFAHNFEDHLLWVNLMKLGKCCNLEEPLIKVRFSSASVTIDEKWRGLRFRHLKSEIIKRGTITEMEGKEILAIIKKQDNNKIKEGSYHALCSKKFLSDNYRPIKARLHAIKAISTNPFRLDNYALLLAGYLPQKLIKWIK